MGQYKLGSAEHVKPSELGFSHISHPLKCLCLGPFWVIQRGSFLRVVCLGSAIFESTPCLRWRSSTCVRPVLIWALGQQQRSGGCHNRRQVRMCAQTDLRATSRWLPRSTNRQRSGPYVAEATPRFGCGL